MATKMNFKRNLKAATSKKQMTDNLWTILAPLPWVVIPSLLKVADWVGFAVAFAGTWLTGVLLNKPGIQSAAFAVGAVQLMYAKGSGVITDTLQVPVWQLGGATSLTGFRGLSSLRNSYLQPNTRVMNLPGVSKPVMTRPMQTASPALSNKYLVENGSLSNSPFEINNEQVGI